MSSVDPRNHSGANYQVKKGSRCVEIIVFQVGGSSVRGAPRFSSTRTLQSFSKVARRIQFFQIGARFRNSFLTTMLCLQLSTVLRVFYVVMLWQSGARRQRETGGVRTGVRANCANHGD